MLFNQKISVVIPALNEAQSVAKVIAEIPGVVDEIIVVDNGSIDGTDEIARKAGARVVYQRIKGYGAACLAGIRVANSADIVGFIDADYSDFPADLLSVIRPVARGEVEFVMGSREGVEKEQGALHWHQSMGNWVACCLIKWCHGVSFCDLGPMRCISKNLLDRIKMQDEGHGWTAEMQLKVHACGASWSQIPVRYRKRIGQSKISGTVKGSVMAACKIIYWTIRLLFEKIRTEKSSTRFKPTVSMVNR